MPTQITIVRHGETEWNLERRMQGQKNSPLTKNGIVQAECVSEALLKRKFDILITSNLGRAVQTTDIINAKLKLPVIHNSNLRERCFGILEGNTGEEAIQEITDVYNSYKKRIPDFIIPDGESLREFYTRVINEFELIAKENNGKNVLVVSHGCVLESLLYKVFSIDLNKDRVFTIRNSSINTIVIDNRNWFLEEWGIVEHFSEGTALCEV